MSCGVKDEMGGYADAILTARSYHLIGGFDDGTFRPNARITREQAMVMLAQAMKITGLNAKLADLAPTQRLRAYADADRVSKWAEESVASGLQLGLLLGRSAAELAPQAFVTRAEAATLVRQLLQKSDLI